MFYLDASVLLKNYWSEVGTKEVRELLALQAEAATSTLTLLEVEAALGRLFREGYLPEDQLLRHRRSFGKIGSECS